VELSRLRRSLEEGKPQRSGAEMDQVKLVMEGGQEYPEKGKLQFRDISVDPTTGSVILRIVVPNPRGMLLQGMFVRAVVEEGANDQAILVPQQAVSRDPRGNAYVMAVDADGKVSQRPIVTERAIGDMWLVSSGLAAGDRIITEGLQKARPGTTVKVAEAPQQAGGAAGAAGAAGAGKAETAPDAATKSN
jgi:membrane fusion protein (multidrug efflux system)